MHGIAIRGAAAIAGFSAAGLALGGPALADDNVLCVQQQLASRGLDPGPLDGTMGGRTRTASLVAAAAAPGRLPDLTTATAGRWCTALKDWRPRLSEAELAEMIFGKTHRRTDPASTAVVPVGADGVVAATETSPRRIYRVEAGKMCIHRDVTPATPDSCVFVERLGPNEVRVENTTISWTYE